MALGAAFVGCAAGDGLAGRQLPRTFEGEIRKRVRLDYLLYLPEAYADGSKRWPLMLFLHGVGERGDELERVKLHGPPMLIEQGRSFPCIVVSPQCPAWQWWAAEPAALAALLDEIERDFRVDPDRIYLTGLSMGGAGTWALAAEQPHRFAAIAPVCGPTNPGTADRIRHLPVWVFHGAKDTTVPLRESETMVEALRALGAEPRLTVYPEAGHDAWTETYANPELYEWLFAQRRAR
ncbi:MAG: prolyl oligopeptidase family serine peptidase [Candidatus Brocadiaceae bacterium]|nr:prolyl oligopeptidase family serine peptidase [Candidatus Brocadiaceae bacterium]